jgi:hypothetical protein
MNAAYQKIVSASSNNDIATIQQIYISLLNDKMKLDKFFSMFLDKLGNKMDPDETDTPVWKLYKQKTKEYSDLDQAIKAANYYLKKGSYV